MAHLTLIGTGHVFQVRQAVEDAIAALQPDIVFVELDPGRLQALVYRERHGTMPPRGGGFVQKRLQAFQEDVAQMYGGQVGEEMLAAVRGAQAAGARVALIDEPAEKTVRRAMKELTWTERLRAFGQLAKAGVMGLFGSSQSRRARMDAEIAKYQGDPEAMLREMERQFPTVHRIVIQERDEIMAKRIRAGLSRPAGAAVDGDEAQDGLRGVADGEGGASEGDEADDGLRGVAVVGDGHVPGMLRALEGLDVTVYRLDDVREGRLPVPQGRVAEGDASDVSFGFDVRF